MGPAHLDKDQTPLRVKTQQLLEKAGFEVVYPEASAGHYCGQPFASKGYPKQADDKLHELEEQLLKASRNGQDPIYSAGDKGFTLPKLNQHALRNLVEQVDSCNAGFSTSRTCEVGLSSYSNLSYQHLVYLVDRASRVKY